MVFIFQYELPIIDIFGIEKYMGCISYLSEGIRMKSVNIQFFHSNIILMILL